MRPVKIQLRVATILRESGLSGNTTRRGTEVFINFEVARMMHHVPVHDGLIQGLAVHGRHSEVQQARTFELAQNAKDASGAMHVLDVVLVSHRRHLAQAGYFARDPVNILHGEIDAGFLCSRQQMQNGIGRAAHRDVQRHGILESFKGTD